MERVFRWAPTPSGNLHLGNVFSMLLTWLEARNTHSKILLRIDDLDQTRSRNEYVEQIFKQIHQIGLDWDLGPQNSIEFYRDFSQSLFQDDYRNEFERLKNLFPELFFVCDCSRKKLEGQENYSGFCRDRKLHFKDDGSCCWRVNSNLLKKHPLGDFIVYRKEALFSYQWVSLQDDIKYGVTDVIRGLDLVSSTQAQLSLAQFLVDQGQSKYRSIVDAHFYHHSLIMQNESKLSKSQGAESIENYLSDKPKLFQIFTNWLGCPLPQLVQDPKELLKFYSEFRQKGASIEVSKTWQIDELLGSFP